MLGPIFVREWRTLPRRPQHYAVRTAYLGLLWVLGLTAWQAAVGWSRPATLGDVARFGLLLFQVSAYFQLTFLLFFSALSAAIAITQEKDRRTFLTLLVTDLRNHEIVLGKLAGSLLQIALLLLGTAALFALNLHLGGVSPGQVAEALVILAATCVAAGSLGCLVALWREQTFPALALTVLLLVLYFCLVRALGLAPLAGAWLDVNTPEAVWSDLQLWLDPYQCLRSVLERPASYAWPIAPPFGFALCMLLGSAVLNGWAIRRLRVWNPSGEPIVRREQVDEPQVEKDRAQAHAAPQRTRQVWANPILWREIRTRAYGRRLFLVKAAYAAVIALLCYYAFSSALAGRREPFAAAYGLLPAAILSLLLVAAQAVTAITSERDKGALDLLLVTDLTPREFIFGKLWGIAYNAKEYLLPPLAIAGVYAGLGLLATPPRGYEDLAAARNGQALVCAIGTLLVLSAFAIVLGVHIGLRTDKSRLAVTQTLATIFFLSAGTLVCIWLIVISGRFDVQWTSFILFVAAGVAGLWWVLNGDRPSTALLVASWVCPLAMLYGVMNVVIGKPGAEESSDPFMPALVIAAAFLFAITAMLVPLLSEFDVALGRTSGGPE
jgi:ABC-type transport system involved in multi-copper enzyme maturation permease subunit